MPALALGSEAINWQYFGTAAFLFGCTEFVVCPAIACAGGDCGVWGGVAGAAATGG